jgi:cohesin loading factor subunit SCC2
MVASIFRGYPRLILDPKAEKWMTSVFESDNEDNKAYLLNLLGSFLQAEADRRALGASDRDVTDLIGSASELHESGISTALVQNMIDHVIESAKSHHHSRQGAAMTVLTFTVNQGLYHPLLVRTLTTRNMRNCC